MVCPAHHVVMDLLRIHTMELTNSLDPKYKFNFHLFQLLPKELPSAVWALLFEALDHVVVRDCSAVNVRYRIVPPM